MEFKFKIAIIFICVSLFVSCNPNQLKKNISCETLKKCKLIYPNNIQQNSYVIINGSQHQEYFENEKYTIKSNLKWINSCEYISTIEFSNLPNFKYDIGDEMHVKFTKIKDNKVVGVAKINKDNYDLEFKIEKLK